MKKHVAAAAWILIALLLVGMLFACAGKEEGFTIGGEPELSDPEFQRTPPPLLLVEYVGSNQVQNDDGSSSGVIDMTNASKGYVAVRCTASKNTQIMIQKDGVQEQYPLSNDGTVNFFPLSMGSGAYTIILYVHTEGNRYQQFLVAKLSATLESEFAPFLVPSKIVDYDASSACVEQSYEITKHCATNLEVVQQVYDWIARNITYDMDKAAALAGTSNYTPNPDDTLQAKTGICYDYASLAAAMLRANGIPTKLIKGDVLSGDGGAAVYHAWNMVWLEETGWIAVELAVNPNDWTRIDTTFAAAGPEASAFIGDGSNYTPMSEH